MFLRNSEMSKRNVVNSQSVRVVTKISVLLAVLSTAILAQDRSRQQFDVTSVKPFTRGAPRAPISCTQGNFVFRGFGVTSLITWALNLQSYQDQELSRGVPSWAWQDPYSFEAKTFASVSPDLCREMALSLLEDRFKLKYHWERRPGKIYELSIAPGGHKLKPVGDDYRGPGPTLVIGGTPSVIPTPLQRGWTWEEFEANLGGFTRGMPIVDKTGMRAGNYIFTLSFSEAASPENLDPDFVTALRLQLGLILRETDGNREFLVIDQLERPDSN